jgi:4-hydroxythreonine-4-phosphate dehydrogenase
VACGDPAGIGPEVALRAVAEEIVDHPDFHFVLIGDPAQLAELNARLPEPLPLPRYVVAPPPDSLVSVFSPFPPLSSDARTPGSAAAARAGLDCLDLAARGCLEGVFSGLITAPVSKEAILRAGIPFVGQTEYLAALSDTPDVTMMLLGDDDRGRWLRVALVTTHLPLRAVAREITPDAVFRTVFHAHAAAHALDLPRARIAVCGLNPHAGEGGMLGDEEKRLIQPALDKARAEGLDVHGPASADTVFHQAFRGDYDVVVSMYHDQGLPPLKLVAFDRGVNWTLGLPFIRTSPDHGTAFDIAGRGAANPSSMRAAIRLAAQLERASR